MTYTTSDLTTENVRETRAKETYGDLVDDFPGLFFQKYRDRMVEMGFERKEILEAETYVRNHPEYVFTEEGEFRPALPHESADSWLNEALGAEYI